MLEAICKSVRRFCRNTNWGPACYFIAAIIGVIAIGVLNAAHKYDLWFIPFAALIALTAFFVVFGLRQESKYRHRVQRAYQRAEKRAQKHRKTVKAAKAALALYRK